MGDRRSRDRCISYVAFHFSSNNGAESARRTEDVSLKIAHGTTCHFIMGGLMPKKKQDRWPELCKLVEEPDGLPVRDVGPWTERKLYFWNRYIDTTTPVRWWERRPGPPAWSMLIYFLVQLFVELKTSGRRIPGSVLIAAHAPKPFTKILACEMDKTTANACDLRLKQSPAAPISKVFSGDCNELIEKVIQEIPDRSLTLAFIDPEGLDARFETIRQLTTNRRVDLLILFADAYDIVRNVELLYFNDPNSKLDQVLGQDSGWRE